MSGLLKVGLRYVIFLQFKFCPSSLNCFSDSAGLSTTLQRAVQIYLLTLLISQSRLIFGLSDADWWLQLVALSSGQRRFPPLLLTRKTLIYTRVHLYSKPMVGDWNDDLWAGDKAQLARSSVMSWSASMTAGREVICVLYWRWPRSVADCTRFRLRGISIAPRSNDDIQLALVLFSSRSRPRYTLQPPATLPPSSPTRSLPHYCYQHYDQHNVQPSAVAIVRQNRFILPSSIAKAHTGLSWQICYFRWCAYDIIMPRGKLGEID